MQTAACLVALAIAQAPGWQRARVGSALAGTAALYSFFDILGAILPRTGTPIVVIWGANLTIAAAHVAFWVWFSFADQHGRWTSVPRGLRWISIGHVLLTAMLGVTGHAVDLSRIQRVQVPWLAVDFVQPSLSPLATLSATITLLLLVLCFGEQIRQARRGVIGAKWNAVGFVVFLACAVEEMLVASGALQFIYLAEVGYLGLVIPVIGQFVRRFIDDAHRLQDLTLALEAQVSVATGERDAAREALAAQERFAALGRMAEGVGHEINNPLQILTLSLDELRESPALAGDAEGAEMVEQASTASERIRLIVTGLRTYAIPGERAIERLGPAALVRDAIDEAKSALGPLPELHAILDPAPLVLVDGDRMRQALGHAIANAVRAVSDLPADRRRVEVRTRTTAGGDALIEVRDNGGGFPASILSRLGEPFVTTNDPGAGPGLGIFIIRGVVAAHGGMLELENTRGGGATLQILLPPAARG